MGRCILNLTREVKEQDQELNQEQRQELGAPVRPYEPPADYGVNHGPDECGHAGQVAGRRQAAQGEVQTRGGWERQT